MQLKAKMADDPNTRGRLRIVKIMYSPELIPDAKVLHSLKLH